MMGTDAETRQLTEKLLAFMAGGIDAAPDDARFNALALEVFAYQFERNAPYRTFCLRRGASPTTVKHWREAPAVPTAAFKEVPLTCFPVDEAVAVYRSSGTTGAKRSQHYLRTLELYEASLKPNFAAHVLPDGEPVRMLILMPPPRMLPNSSLVHMLEVARKTWGSLASGHFIDEGGLQKDRLVDQLRDAERTGERVALLGTAFSFVHLLDYCAERGLRFSLPPGSRIMDTGGYKGRSREVPKADLYRMYSDVLGVPESHVVNEYGMTEMGSQFYDNVLRDAKRFTTKTQRVQKLSPPPRSSPVEGEEVENKRVRYKRAPPWVRTLIVDPETLEPFKATPSPGGRGPIRIGLRWNRRGRGERSGLLRHYDLANLGSVMALQTDDLGVAVGDGFEILGRATGAEARGCSIDIDEMLSQ